MKKSVKFFSMLLAIIMVFSIIPLTAWATEDAAEEETAVEEIRGFCGEGTEWIFDENTGTLNILGIGTMDDYTDGTQPWAEYRPNIIRVVIDDKITNIGAFAFANCPDLEEVEIGENVEKIGASAFSDCTDLYTITLSWKTKEIGEAAFSNCKSLRFIEIPDGTETIAQSTFFNCVSLEAVLLPDTLRDIEIYAFQWCTNLQYIYYAGIMAEWKVISISPFNEALSEDKLIVDYCKHRYMEYHKAVPSNCKETGYTEGLYCVECDKYLFGRDVVPVDKKNHDWVIKCSYKDATCTKEGWATFVCSRDKCHIKTGKSPIDPTNHQNTEYSAPVEATADTLGYTEGEYCKDCKTYISGHKPLPLKAINFKDSDVAFLVGQNIITDTEIKLDMILSHVTDENSYVTDVNEESYSVKEYGKTGLKIVTSKQRVAYLAVIGDANGDGDITASDARIALRTSVKLDKYEEGNFVLAACDVNGDDVVAAKDARLILRASVGLEEDLFALRLAAVNND